jgi:restriction system protein
MAVMSSWRDYQEEAAAFFRDLGHEATTDERITGARATHMVDVAVRTKRAIPQLWVVECKRWQRPVNKEHVAALSEIVKDLGAHSGIMLSESGFQAGAILVARFSNVTLTSLSTLRESVTLADVSAADLLAFFGELIRGVAARAGPPPPTFTPIKPLPEFKA